jgi:hypothetical protein
MAKEEVHSKLLTGAARKVLRPAGFTQKGRSRTWLDDRSWWVGVVEFQPSSWSKGSYLNIGVMWLWPEKNYISFDVGGRENEFIEYTDEMQFKPVAEIFASTAFEKAMKYRDKFSTVALAADYLSQRPDSGRPQYNAGVACGLAGYSGRANDLFQAVCALEADTDWMRELHRDCQELISLLKSPSEFMKRIEKNINSTRANLKLEPIALKDFCN